MGIMRIAGLLVCLGYWGLLTVLLLAPHPAGVVGLQRIPVFPWGDVGIHFTAFTLLSLLAHGAQWPRRLAWRLVVVLLAYGIATESLQAFVPPRTVELLDYIENILGVLAGSGVYWVVQLAAEPRTQAHLAAELVRLTAEAQPRPE